MKKYRVEIIETLQRTVEVEAENAGKAWELVNEQYKNQAIVLDASDYGDTEINVEDVI